MGVQNNAIDNMWIQIIKFVVCSVLGSLWKVISGAEVSKMDGVGSSYVFPKAKFIIIS